ncbi:hypothetical protein ONZ45_g12057 [Pleurotus djamor]|nr:hypothetical protein ONZ45_g12057 [Pleurotus djamor]
MSSLELYLPLALALFLLARWQTRLSRTPASSLPLPPGPPSTPVIGNLFDTTNEKPWLLYDEWFNKYGDIVHINVLGQPIVILGSKRRTFDLFEKRSSKYSDRVRLPMLNELSGWHFNFAFMSYGPWWRRHRRLFHKYFHPNTVTQYQSIQTRESHAFLRRLFDTPDDFLHHIRQTFAGTIMDITYGIRIHGADDPYISIAEEAFTSLRIASVPGTFLVDLCPALKFIPAWLPGASFKRKAARWEAVNHTMVHMPFDAVKRNLETNDAAPSILRDMLTSLPEALSAKELAEEETIARNCAGIAYAGGADTSTISVQVFFLAMAMHPEEQRKAQKELDFVCGGSRLPMFSDRGALPYINAIIKEVVRWQPASPLAIAHACSVDDEYDGYFIPKGSIVVGNTWSILHDPQEYPEPDRFLPNRFLKADGSLNDLIQDPYTAVFGYGRRVCPGRYLGDSSLFSVVSSVLAVYDILPPVDKGGQPMNLEAKMTSGLLSYPEPYKCIIQPRSTTAKHLLSRLEVK